MGVLVFRDLGYKKIPLDVWMVAAADRLIVPGLDSDELDPFKRHMRSLIPAPWHHRGRIEVATVLNRDERLKPHEHPEWTLVYYVYFGSDPVGTLLVGKDRKLMRPAIDSAILIPPGVIHEVPAVSGLRVSIAFRVYAHDRWNLA